MYYVAPEYYVYGSDLTITYSNYIVHSWFIQHNYMHHRQHPIINALSVLILSEPKYTHMVNIFIIVYGLKSISVIKT